MNKIFAKFFKRQKSPSKDTITPEEKEIILILRQIPDTEIKNTLILLLKNLSK